MPLLSWLDVRVSHEQREISPGHVKLILRLSQVQIEALCKELENVYQRQGRELRLVISQEWTLFWKLRVDGSRVLLARPTAQEWVGTVALEQQAGEKLLKGIRELELGAHLLLHEWVVLHPVSNLVLQIQRDH
jgi:hypothetical protein